MRHCEIMLLVSLMVSCGCQSSDSKGEDQYEQRQTEKNLGVKVENFPGPGGIYNFHPLGKKLPEIVFSMKEQEVSMPRPQEYYKNVKIVKVRTLRGVEYEAMHSICGDKELAEGHGFKTDWSNRRHHYGNVLLNTYLGSDLFIGQREEGKLKPILFFRDIGDPATKPFHMAMDSRDFCHLVVTDMNRDRGNLFKLYWLVGDLREKKWIKAWLVHYQKKDVGNSEVSLLRCKGRLHCAWYITEQRGMVSFFHLRKDEDGFSPKTLILREQHIDHFDMAADEESGQLVIVLLSDKGLQMMAKLPGEEWSKPVWLLRMDKSIGSLSYSLKTIGKSRFALRTSWAVLSSGQEIDKQFLITNIEKKR